MFEVQVVAREAVKSVKPILDAIKDAETRDQLKRASLSVVLNIAEGNARRGKDKLNRFSFAEGSAREAIEAIITAVAWGYVTQRQAQPVMDLFDRTVAMLVRLRFPRAKTDIARRDD